MNARYYAWVGRLDKIDWLRLIELQELVCKDEASVQQWWEAAWLHTGGHRVGSVIRVTADAVEQVAWRTTSQRYPATPGGPPHTPPDGPQRIATLMQACKCDDDADNRDDIPFIPSINNERDFAVVKEEYESKAKQALCGLSVDVRLGEQPPPGDTLIFTHLCSLINVQDVAESAVDVTAEKVLMGFLESEEVSLGEGCRVAILDSDVCIDDPAISGNVAGTIDCTGTGWDNNTRNGSGRFIASMIVSGFPKDRPVGSARRCSLYLMKVVTADGWGTDSWLARGIDAAVDCGVNVILIPSGSPHYLTLTQASLLKAYSMGIAVVASGGMSGGSADDVDYPARYEQCVAVGSIDKLKRLSIFTSVGPDLDILAVGEEQVGATGVNRWQRWSGPALSAAHVAAAVAQLFDAYVDCGCNEAFPRVVLKCLVRGSGRTLSTDGACPGWGHLIAGKAVTEMPTGPTPPTERPADKPTHVVDFNIDRTGIVDVLKKVCEILRDKQAVTIAFRPQGQ